MENIPERDEQRLARLIESEESPVGIDAKKTHVLILALLERLERRLSRLEAAIGIDDRREEEP